MELFRKATALPEGEAPSAGELADEDREILSKRHLDFADRHASAQTIAELAATLADCYPKYGKKVQSRKRAATSAAAEEPGSKKAAADGTPTQDSAAAAVANGSSAATAVDPGTAAATSTSEGEACMPCTYAQCQCAPLYGKTQALCQRSKQCHLCCPYATSCSCFKTRQTCLHILFCWTFQLDSY